jgi:hypothetical protein
MATFRDKLVRIVFYEILAEITGVARDSRKVKEIE